jgi:hypothetical protein
MTTPPDETAISPHRIWSGILAFMLALMVVMPPKFLSVYVLAAGLMAAAYFLRFGAVRQLRPESWAVLALLAGAALFCALGTLPITSKSDIQLEFAKYAVYAASFMAGMALLRRAEQARLLATFLALLIGVALALVAISSDQRLVVDQTWPLYPPDQNNSTAILIPVAFLSLFFPRALHRALLLLGVFFLILLVESRLGVILTSVFIVSNAVLRRDRWAFAAIILAAGLWVALDSGPRAPQAALIEAVQTISAGPASLAEQAGIPVPVAPPPPQTDMPAPKSVLGFGLVSDSFRFQIYSRAIEIAGQTFPNLLGMGDAQVAELLNTPQIYWNVRFTHAHNFLLQSYLAYGLLATLCIVALFAVLLTMAIRRRHWALTGMLLLVAGLGMIESLTSDIRVLATLFALIGALVAPISQKDEKP